MSDPPLFVLAMACRSMVRGILADAEEEALAAVVEAIEKAYDLGYAEGFAKGFAEGGAAERARAAPQAEQK